MAGRVRDLHSLVGWPVSSTGRQVRQGFDGAAMAALAGVPGRGQARPVNKRRVSELLAMEVLERLHQLDLVAAGERRSAVEVERIRREMRRMIAVWRSLLEGHRADSDGRCPRCRTGWRRRQRWPCGVWIAAQKSLIRHRAGWPAMSTGFPDSGGHAPAQLPLRVDVVAATPPPGPPITEADRPGPSSPGAPCPECATALEAQSYPASTARPSSDC